MSSGTMEGKFASQRAFATYMIAHPGKKLNFMGNDFSQVIEWNYEKELDWMLLGFESHRKMNDFYRDLNHLYKDLPAFWHDDDSWDGFKWICADDYTQSVISFRRIDNSDPEKPEEIIVVCNFVPVQRNDYKIGVPYEGTYEQIFSTDDIKYGGSGEVDNGRIKAKEYSMHGCDYSISLTIPGLSAMFFRHVTPKTRRKKAGDKIDVTGTASVKETSSSKEETTNEAPKKSSRAAKAEKTVKTEKNAAKKPAEAKAADVKATDAKASANENAKPSAETASKKKSRRSKTDKSAE